MSFVCIYLFSKHTRQHIISLLILFNVTVGEVCPKFEKKTIKSLKSGKFWVFVIFCVNLRHFNFRDCNKLFTKAYWTTHAVLDGPFHCSISQSPTKIRKKINETFENWKILEFVSFLVSIQIFSFGKQQLSLQKSVLGQIFSAMLSMFQHSNPRNLSKN